MESDLRCGLISKEKRDRKIAAITLERIGALVANMKSAPTRLEVLDMHGYLREGWESIDCPEDPEISNAYSFALHYISDIDIILTSEQYKSKVTEQLREYLARLRQ